jgi:hypothetical protein|tara:strand:- start:36 stop:1007 length:972 start_codon:yes stop_codon:yes gene_type:complete
VEETTESNLDGSIESAAEALLQQPETEENEVEEDQVAPEIETEDAEEDEHEEEHEEDEDDITEDAEDEEDDAVPESQTFTVKIDGEEKAVTLDELKQGFSGQKFVQRGMQENAQARKQTEQVYNALLESRQQVTELFSKLQNGGVTRQPIKPDIAMLDTDPIGYVEQNARFEQNMMAYQNEMQQFQQVQNDQLHAQNLALEAHRNQEMTRLLEIMPDLKDPTKGKVMRDQMLSVGNEYGYGPEEISAIIDHRAIRVLEDARKYREIVAGKSKAVAKATQKKRTQPLKAGSKKASSSQKELRNKQSRLKNSGSIDDAVAMILGN